MAFNFNELPAEAEPASEALALPELPAGVPAVIDSVDSSGPVGRRLQDLGFVPDTVVTMVRRAPLGDPAEYALRGVRFCLRRNEAARITVRPR